MTALTTTSNCGTVPTGFHRCSAASVDAVIQGPSSRLDELCGSLSSQTTQSNTSDFMPPFISSTVIKFNVNDMIMMMSVNLRRATLISSKTISNCWSQTASCYKSKTHHRTPLLLHYLVKC